MATYAVLRELCDDPDQLDVKLGLVEEDEPEEIDELENQRRRRMLLASADVTVA